MLLPLLLYKDEDYVGHLRVLPCLVRVPLPAQAPEQRLPLLAAGPRQLAPDAEDLAVCRALRTRRRLLDGQLGAAVLRCEAKAGAAARLGASVSWHLPRLEGLVAPSAEDLVLRAGLLVARLLLRPDDLLAVLAVPVGLEEKELELLAADRARPLVLRAALLMLRELLQGHDAAAVDAVPVGPEILRLQPALAQVAELPIPAALGLVLRLLLREQRLAAVLAMGMGGEVFAPDVALAGAAQLHPPRRPND
mmetsp:Transcript_95543/g.297464  ORF Transcript_95543/g.297464 Transcript_95543/m.297464 type:complete len:250 (+) Transcript_95543:67-816(+)